MNTVQDCIVETVLSSRAGPCFRSHAIAGLLKVDVGGYGVILYKGRAYLEKPHHYTWNASLGLDAIGNPREYTDAAEFPQEVFFHVANQVLAGEQ